MPTTVPRVALLAAVLSLSCAKAKEWQPGYYLVCEHPVLNVPAKVWHSSEPIEFHEGAYFVGDTVVAPGALVCATSRVP